MILESHKDKDELISLSQNLKFRIFYQDLLLHSKKYSRYTDAQKIWIAKDYFSKITPKEIIKKYKVSKSSLFKIVKNARNNKKNLKLTLDHHDKSNFLTKEEEKFIKDYIKPLKLLSQ